MLHNVIIVFFTVCNVHTDGWLLTTNGSKNVEAFILSVYKKRSAEKKAFSLQINLLICRSSSRFLLVIISYTHSHKKAKPKREMKKKKQNTPEKGKKKKVNNKDKQEKV